MAEKFHESSFLSFNYNKNDTLNNKCTYRKN